MKLSLSLLLWIHHILSNRVSKRFPGFLFSRNLNKRICFWSQHLKSCFFVANLVLVYLRVHLLCVIDHMFFELF